MSWLAAALFIGGVTLVAGLTIWLVTMLVMAEEHIPDVNEPPISGHHPKL